ncbi:hypothetical protein ISM_01250 [Roseovarius nubinhibens ISM]|uniref:Uncharacterized protein n=1 Tax=Roseovarius nubinhibens (strain ATCC BAA-591 / DSM 15170 / ISM) TaxID=89187 RepID=A3SHP2_ROSNI|nr:hypothetical protein ISM_01250 [Roseovarius nubinhibens ISM]
MSDPLLRHWLYFWAILTGLCLIHKHPEKILHRVEMTL